MTIISSQFFKFFILCEIKILVLSFNEKIVFNTLSSVKLSNAFVASSKIKKFELLYKALAIPILCFWPPDKFEPLSPTRVFSLLLKLLMNSLISAILTTDSNKF